jgi:hypothetical protein
LLFRTVSSTPTNLLALFVGLNNDENLWAHIHTDSLEAYVKQNLSEISLRLNPAMNRITE